MGIWAMEDAVDDILPKEISELIGNFARCSACDGKNRFTRFSTGRSLQLENMQVTEIKSDYGRACHGGPYGLRVSGAGPLDGEYIIHTRYGGAPDKMMTFRRQYRDNNTYDDAVIAFIPTPNPDVRGPNWSGVRWGIKDTKGRLCYLTKETQYRGDPDEISKCQWILA